MSLADRAGRLIGVEIVPAAVECAKQNAALNGLQNADFRCADAGDPATLLACLGDTTPDVVILDPPRKGSTNELIDALAQRGITRLVYISCDADTLARDCVRFRENGYEIGVVTPVDMFPRTGHVESVVCLTQKV
jgi:23S rRNA (uracil1939-C5)-methyltransferase